MQLEHISQVEVTYLHGKLETVHAIATMLHLQLQEEQTQLANQVYALEGQRAELCAANTPRPSIFAPDSTAADSTTPAALHLDAAVPAVSVQSMLVA